MMLRYVAKRLGMTVVVIVLVTLALGLFVHLIPGDPVTAMLGRQADPAYAAHVRHELMLDRSVWVQLWDFGSHAVQGDLGRDAINERPVSEIIWKEAPNTVILAVTGLLLAVTAGIPLGVYAATHPGGRIDRVIGVISVGLTTIPPYVAALLLLLAFSVSLQIFPTIGAGTLSQPVDYLKHLALPAIALALAWTGYLARIVRANMLEVLSANYIRAAHAFGLERRVVFYKYALKNALIPVVAVLGVALGTLMGGAVFVEIVFTRSGLGTVLYNAISLRNFPVVRGSVLVIAVLFVLANLLADLTYYVLDPRLRVRTNGRR